MDSPNRPRNHEVDELRGAAALLVLFYHSVHSGLIAIGSTGWPRAHYLFDALLFEGHTGVALFMVLSGYILATGTFDRHISYWGFIRNRALRIFPLMFVVLVFSMYSVQNIDLGKILAPFLLLANTSASFTDPAGLSGTDWTIAVEFQFYLIAPFLFAFTGSKGFKFLLSAMFLFWLLRMIVLLPLQNSPSEMYHLSYFTIAGRINQFLLGIGLAYLFHSGRIDLKKHPRSTLSLVVCSAAILLAMNALNHSGGVTMWHLWRTISPEIEGFLWSSFIAAYLISRPLQDLKVGDALYAIGQISFSMYILHYAVQLEFWNFIYPSYLAGSISSIYGILFVTAILAGLIAAVSWLSYTCIERPFQDMRGRYISGD